MNEQPASTPDLPSDEPLTWRRFIPLLIVVALGLTLIGFVAGIADTPPAARPKPVATHDPNSGAAQPARSYRELFVEPLSPNASWQSELHSLKFEKPDIFATVVRTEELKQVALAERARIRAYEGAPPVIPHPVDQRDVASCLKCHGDGVKVDGRVAVKISHANFTGCTQCHVESHGSSPVADEPIAENTFVGAFRSGPVSRALVGSPPVIPHTTWLREDCTSCHGLIARPGLRTTHPWLTNCVQCHATSAELDRVPFAAAPHFLEADPVE